MSNSTLNSLFVTTPADVPATCAPWQLEREVRCVEYEWGDAYLRRDMAALEGILADDYTFTDPLGEISDKRENLAHIRSGACVIEATTSRDIRVRIYDHTAIVTARSHFKARYKGFGFQGQCQYTDILVKRDGRWRAVASQATLARRGVLLLSLRRFLGDRLAGSRPLFNKIGHVLTHRPGLNHRPPGLQRNA
ncbi:MAG: nuclear transport factor 2 family protein [Acidobacteriota bacterium]|nr:nuclear transport factor 2 family protein [Acidobacteriota bacterium]